MRSENIKVFLLILVIVVLFILLKNGQIFDIGGLFRLWLAPRQPVNSLLAPPDNLEESYKNLLVINSQLKTLADENEQLKNLLDFKQSKEFNLVVANILSHDSFNNNILIIDVGLKQNIKKGQAVVINDGIIIGKVIDVTTDAATVRLLTDNFSKLAVTVGDESVAGLLSGSLGLGLEMSYIPQEYDIKKNDLVVTADLDTNIPKGLIIGTVEEIQYSEEELFKTASVLPLVDFNTLSIVAIITQ